MAVSKLATKYMFEDWGAERWNSREGAKITTIVVHHAALTDFDLMPGLWKEREASAHYGIGPDGTIRAYVDEDKRAWHCGNGNSYSIGIENTNITREPDWKVSDKTVDSLVELIKEIESRLGKMIILGHKDMPGTSTECCGPSLYPRLQEIRDRVNGSNTENSTGYQISTYNKQVQTTYELNVRSSPTNQSKQVASLPKGTVVTATKICSNGEAIKGNSIWYEQNAYGWISSEYTKPVPEPTSPPVQNDVDYMRQYGYVIWNDKEFNVDDRSQYAGIWQVISNELGGLTPSAETSEIEWINNGVPMSEIDWTDGTPQSSLYGNRFKFQRDRMDIVAYDVPSNGIAVMLAGHKVWVDATVARRA